MNNAKLQQLETAYHTVIQVCLYDMPIQEIEEYLAEEVLLYGTGIDEIANSKKTFCELIQRQREQAAGIEMSLALTPVLRNLSGNENNALYVDQIQGGFHLEGVQHNLFFRLSSHFEYCRNKWQLLHLHCSTPSDKQAEGESWPIKEWRTRNEELKKMLAEKTIALEQKNNELRIEAALERVRARAMAMHKSDELQNAAMLMFQQVQALGLPPFACGFNIWDDDRKGATSWMAREDALLPPFKISSSEDVFLDIYEAAQRGESLFVKEQGGIELEAHYNYMASIPAFKDIMEKMSQTGISVPTFQIIHCAFFSHGYLGFITYEPVREAWDIFKRFAKVFDQTYTRFLDLQKAEAQAREAKIEMALERVRSSSLAMHNTDELKEVITIVLQNLQELGVAMEKRSALIDIFEEGSKDAIEWVASPEHSSIICFRDAYFDHPMHNDRWNAREQGIEFFSKSYSKEVKNAAFESIFQHTDLKHFPEEEKHYLLSADYFELSIALKKHSAISIANLTNVPLTSQDHDILIRFSKVFEQAYTRFLDLQKAEAQAREAQIEAALERVRARAMAMQNTEDVASATAVMFKELFKLGIQTIRCGILFIHENKTVEVWNSYTDKDGEIGKIAGLLDMNTHPLLQQAFIAWQNKDEIFHYKLDGKDREAYYSVIAQSPTYSLPVYNEPKDTHYCNIYFFEEGGLYSFTQLPPSSEIQTVMKKFTAVFSLTFRRYQDLKRAEAQAREAQIQLALERVRARTMAMQRSEELAQTVELLFEEFRKLRILNMNEQGAIDRAVIGIINEPNHSFDFWLNGLDGEQYNRNFSSSLDEPLTVTKLYRAWKEGATSLVIDLQGEQLKQWVDYLQTIQVPVKPQYMRNRRVHTYAFFSKGSLGITTDESVAKESVELLQRFAVTFDLTYTRFNDLKEAESRAALAVREASLDRVRAQIASMRTAEDLQHITPLIWRELIALGVPFFRCGVFIVNDEKQKIHFYLSSPDGNPLAALELGFDSTDLIHKATQHWRRQKVYIAHWNKTDFLQFAQNLIALGQIQNVNTYQGGNEAPESITLQFVPFAQGMMYVGSAEDLSITQIELVQSLADTFSTAYARYEDFTKLEAAKQEIEFTLKDLRATQAQLIQSEKMASLGELTAGIAHEIQNPLNFVNNFSEVNKELLIEMKAEIEKGNTDEVKAIAKDIIDNEEKINHHGKRADAIVKSMLQHSRSSTGKKEPTDINALADEYLRLAYHGLRAKDKSFNATMKTDFDESIGNIHIIPQDIGRVILNLLTNAFYVVNEKKLLNSGGYEPTVSVSTKKMGNKIELSVKDNGLGIPQKVIDKIFQPFFTTKPTGQGTGLGLSMSYDIIKAHGGELKVKTKEGEYTMFIIQLPIV